MAMKTIPLTDQAPNYEDPYCEIHEFIYQYGNPIYIYQGGPDDSFALLSTKPVSGATRGEEFIKLDRKIHQ